MKKLVLIYLSVFILVCIFTLKITPVSKEFEIQNTPQISYEKGMIVIQFEKEVRPVIPRKLGEIIQTGISSVDILCQDFKVHTMRRQFPAPKFPTPDLTRHFIVLFDESKDLDAVVNAFSKNSFIEKAEKVAILDLSATPNDTWWPNQWYLYEYEYAVDIDAIEAWDIQTGSSNVILAIPDTGVKYPHPDLTNNTWINTYEDINGDGMFTKDDINYVDDDPNGGNGYVDDVTGWDFYHNDCSPQDIDGHGTRCAGIAAAETNNNEGVAGIAGGWYPSQEGCKIMRLQIGEEGSNMAAAASAFVYATDMGAFAINCSWDSHPGSGFLEAVNYAIQNGVLVVASAGNEGQDMCSDRWEHYLTTRLDVMVVAATDYYDRRATFSTGASNYGDCVDISAPGKHIYSTCVDTAEDCGYEDYSYGEGTSMAAPMVVGLAGLLKSQRPDWGREEIWEAIVSSADPLEDEGMGAGRINAYSALKQTWVPDAPSNLNAWPTAYNQINLSWQDNSDNESGFKIQRRTSSTEFSTIKTLGKNVTSYQDKTCTIGVTYYY